jgi:hypothetical protein
MRAVLSFHNFSFNSTKKANGGLKLPIFETSGVHCYFLNFGVKIEKSLKLQGVK